MATKDEVVAAAEAKMLDRVFAKVLRNLPDPTYVCPSDPDGKHRGANFTLVEWRTEGTGANDDWWCDACETAIRNGTTDLYIKGVQPQCTKCHSPLVEAGQRRPVVVKVRPCLQCGLIFWEHTEV